MRALQSWGTIQIKTHTPETPIIKNKNICGIYFLFFFGLYIIHEHSKMVLGDVTNQIIEQCIKEIHKKDNRDRIRLYILDPAAKYIRDYIKPYLIALMVVLLFILGLLFRILTLLGRLTP